MRKTWRVNFTVKYKAAAAPVNVSINAKNAKIAVAI